MYARSNLSSPQCQTIDQFIRCFSRARTDVYGKEKLADALAKRERTEKRVRSLQRKLDAQPRTWIRRDAMDRSDWQRWRDTAQKEHDEAVAEVKWLSDIVRGLSPWERPALIVRKAKIGDGASEAVKTLVSHMAELLPITVVEE
ncbi:hypothetical protein V5O48_014574 [Marasmius crinis-equi]|uniref:Uncharacterized protein n=1 Tax=Marasmius crinis-equi TaxID=585013 RepID=A0ABR3EWX0_9AGAR